MDISNFHYLWLRRNDSDWLEEHLPSPLKVPRNQDVLNWETIDREISEEIKKVCDEILRIKTFPVRVSITEIITRTGYKSWIEKREKKLPLTDKVINRSLESLEDFMIRKVKWAKEKFLKKGTIPSKPQFKAMAVLNNRTSNESPKVQQAIDKALEELVILLNEF